MSSKMKASGKGRGGGAGMQFDKLLKLCSNAKKSSSPTGGKYSSLGRSPGMSYLGVQKVGSEFSKYSSLHKKPKLNTPSVGSPVFRSDDGVSKAPLATTTVYKPRKFFKSRDPIEVQVDPSIVTKPLCTERQNWLPSQEKPTKQRKTKNSKQTAKTLRNATNSAPNNSASLTSCSPPIKLRIFKDKTTSKLVSVSDAAPPTVDSDKCEPSVAGVTKKVSKKRGRKPKTRDSSEDDSLPQTDVSAPPAKHGRTTRNSSKMKMRGRGESSDSAGMPALNRADRSSVSSELENGVSSMETTVPFLSPDTEGSGNNDSSSFVSRTQHPGSLEMHETAPNLPLEEVVTRSHPNLKALEEDQEFQKLTEMLTSMEQGTGEFNQVSMNYGDASSTMKPVNLSCSSAGGYSEENCHQSFPSSMNTFSQYIPSIPKVFAPEFPIKSESSDPAIDAQARKAEDIRAILEDDWNETFDEEAVRKTPHYDTQSYSPPKVSRFDPSAFQNQLSQSTTPFQPYPQDYMDTGGRYSPVKNTSTNQAVGTAQLPTNVQTMPSSLSPTMSAHQQAPFQSSPYAVRNLLSVPLDNMNAEAYASHEGIDEPENLVCHKAHDPSLEIQPSEESSSQKLSEELHPFTQQSSLELFSSLPNSQSSNLSLSQSSSGSHSQPSVQSKKGSIFKSRAQNTQFKEGDKDVGKKRQALYKHRFEGQDFMDETKADPAGEYKNKVPAFEEDPEEFDENPDLRLRKLKIEISSAGRLSSSFMHPEESTLEKITCKKETKKLFTVVRNVKPIHELQESGEVHEFDGDIWYILEDLKDTNPLTKRCLSAITLAQRCMEPAFRMHLRAHGTVAEFCKELHDAPQHPALALLASTVLFVLSQDRLNMDLDTETLKLILALSKSDNNVAEESSFEIARNRQRVIDICEEMKTRGHVTNLKLATVTASELALETLLLLTSKRAGEWVKHELRSLGGLDHIVTEIENSINWVKSEVYMSGYSETVMESVRKVDRCLQVLQQVTFNHEDNQHYLLGVSERKLDETSNEMVKCYEASPSIFNVIFRFCKMELEKLSLSSEAALVIRELLFSNLRLLVNLSHDYRGIVLGSEILMNLNGFYELALHSVLLMTNYFPDEKVFDLLMHSLCLLLNLVEYSKSIRRKMLTTIIYKKAKGGYSLTDSYVDNIDDQPYENREIPILDVLVEVFLEREKAAKEEEQSTDNILDKGTEDTHSKGNSQNSSVSEKSSQESEGSSSVQEIISKLIQTAGKHMENSLIAAYISLLLSCLIMDDQGAIDHVRESMPDKKFLHLMIFLKKLFNFMSITTSASGSTRGLKAIANALRFFGKVDPDSNKELKSVVPD